VQRRSILDAAKIAGLNPLRLINETTAIALQYGTGRPITEARKVCFYDMGVSSTDVSIVTISGQGLKVEAVASDRNLGGRVIDEILAEYLAVQIKDKYKLDVASNQKAWLKLRKEADRVKQYLSANTKVPYAIEYLLDGVDVAGVVTREELHTLLDKHVKDRLLAPLQFVLERSNTKLEDLHSLEMVGGCTRVPYIQTLVRDFFGRDVSKTCDSDESVCRGATLQCAMLSPSFKVRDYEVKEVAPYAIEVEWQHKADATPASLHEPLSTEDRVRLVELYAPTPAVKIVTIKETRLPLLVAAKYVSSGQPTFPAADATIARCLVTAPAGAALPEQLKLKLKVKIDASGNGSIVEATAVEEKEVEVEEEAPVDPAAAAAPAPAPEAPMTDDAAAAEPAPAPAKQMIKVMKKQTVKTPLEMQLHYPCSLDQVALNKAADQEHAMAYADRVVRETAEIKNELEGYILNTRTRVQDKADLGKYFEPAAADAFVSRLRKEEDWLDDEGYDESKETYAAKLAELRAIGAEAMEKSKEDELREEAFAKFTEEMNKGLQWAATKDPKYDHIPAEERAKVQQRCDAAVMEAAQAMEKQRSQPPTAPLAITVAKLQSAVADVTRFAQSIMNKPKPAPKADPKPTPKAEAKEEAKPAEGEAPKAEGEAAAEPAAEGDEMVDDVKADEPAKEEPAAEQA
jgi:heat shock protein 4